MPSKMKTCEDYRTALTDAAAAAVQPSLELRSHLDACASCHAAFTEELQLFAAIDTGLRATANAEVRSSFLPGVRASLENASAPRRLWTPSLIFAAASAAIVLTVFIAARPRRAINDNQAKQILAVPSREKSVTPDREVAGTPTAVTSLRSKHVQQRRESTSPSSASPSQFEVIVPPEEREAFGRFVSAQQERSSVVIAVVALASGKEDPPLSLEPLLIAKLRVRPLEPLEGDVSDRTEEEQ